MSADVHQQVFIQEAQDLLAELEESLLELEETPDDMETVARIFRAMHTIKGSGAMFGFEHIASLVHSIETTYDMVRNSKLTVTKEMLDHSLRSCDVIKDMLTDPAMKADTPEALAIKDFFEKLGGKKQKEPSAPVDKKNLMKEKDLKTFRITFKPNENILLQDPVRRG